MSSQPLEIFISAKVTSIAQAHAVLAALHGLSARKAFNFSNETVTVSATDNVPEELHQPSSHIQKTLDREFGHSHNPITPSENITAQPCPHPPVSKIFESVRQRVLSKLNAGLQPNKDDFGCASAMVQKKEILWDGEKFVGR